MTVRASSNFFDTEKFIEEVKKRPILYDSTLSKHSTKEMRNEMWEEISEIMYSDWDQLSPEAKLERVRQTNTRWKSIRDHFTKQIRIRVRHTQGGLKRKKYVYYDQLTFLLPHVESRRGGVYMNNSQFGDSLDYDQSQDPLVEFPQYTSFGKVEPMDSDDEYSTNPEISYIPPNDQPICKSEMDRPTPTPPETSRDEKRQDRFGNRGFLDSLLPLMNKLEEEDVLDVRIKIMQTIQTALMHKKQNSNISS